MSIITAILYSILSCFMLYYFRFGPFSDVISESGPKKKAGIRQIGVIFMNVSSILIMAAIICYLGLMLVIGFHFSRTNTSTDDFYLGGRKLGPFVTAMSAEASDMSSWLLMGLPGVAYLSGVCDAAWTAIGLALGTWLNWFFISKKIRRYSHQIGAITIPDFFSKRYHDKNMLNCIAAIVIVVFFIPYTASGFAACGKLFSTLFGVDYMAAMVICAIIIVAYTTLGGFLAASTTDLIQSIVMTIALITVVFYSGHMAGGFDVVLENAKALPGYLSLSNTYDLASNAAKPYGIITICSMLAWGLGYFGMPHVLLRFMAIEDENKLTTSRRIATVWVVISMAVAIFIGICGLAVSKAGRIDTLSGSDSETIIVKIAASLIAARITVILISVIAIFLARDPSSSVFGIVSFAWAGFGAAFGPVMLCALFWKRSNKYGAFASMLSGGIMIFVWKYLVRPMGGALDIYELLPAFLIALAFNITVSLLTEKPDAAIEAEFDNAIRS